MVNKMLPVNIFHNAYITPLGKERESGGGGGQGAKKQTDRQRYRGERLCVWTCRFETGIVHGCTGSLWSSII